VAEPEDRLSRDLADALQHAHADELAHSSTRPAAWASGALPDLRPTSPLQVLIVGGVLVLGRALGLYHLLGLDALSQALNTLGLLILAFGVITWLMRPPRRQMYWRGRRIDLDPSRSWPHRLYRLVYRDS
jgi:hypothetical protein